MNSASDFGYSIQGQLPGSACELSAAELDAMEAEFLELGRQGGNRTLPQDRENETVRPRWLALRAKLRAAGRLK